VLWFGNVPGGPLSDALCVGRHYLDVQHAKKEAKTRVWVYAKNDTDAQLWRFDDKGRLERFLLSFPQPTALCVCVCVCEREREKERERKERRERERERERENACACVYISPLVGH
jgi:hypothetical protein